MAAWLTECLRILESSQNDSQSFSTIIFDKGWADLRRFEKWFEKIWKVVLGTVGEDLNSGVSCSLPFLSSGLTLGASYLSFIFLSFCGRHQKHKVPANGPYNWSPGLIAGATWPAVGPKGPNFGQKPGAGFITLSSLRSALSSISRRCCAFRSVPVLSVHALSDGALSFPIRPFSFLVCPLTRCTYSVAVKPVREIIIFVLVFWLFWAGLLPKLAPGPL